MKSFTKSAIALAAAVLIVPGAAQAQNVLVFQDVTFNIDRLDADTFSLTITNADDATGDWAGIDYLKAFEIKDIGDVTGATMLTGSYSFASWGAATLNAGVSGSGLGCTTGGTNGFCFSAGAAVAVAPAMTWTFDVFGTGLDFLSAPHLKLQFLDEFGSTSKQGSLLSQTIPAIPEPQTYALMLAGLAAVGFMARRRRRRQD